MMLKKLLGDKLSGNKAPYILLIIGFIGIALIFLSNIFQPSSKNSGQTQTSSDTSNAFEINTEQRLESIIGKIDGVGRVKVMVTVQSSA
jgi:stage III sporulation protein AG